jgi:hypothetical protein
VTVRIYSADSAAHELSLSADSSGRLVGESDEGRTWVAASVQGDVVIGGKGLEAVSKCDGMPRADAESIVKGAVDSVFAARVRAARAELSDADRRALDRQETRAVNKALVDMTVKNAVSGEAVGAARVTVQNEGGDAVAQQAASESGRLSVQLPFGSYTISAAKPGFQSVVQNVLINKGSVALPVLLTPPLDALKKQIRVIVRWNDATDAPRDLDAYLQVRPRRPRPASHARTIAHI